MSTQMFRHVFGNAPMASNFTPGRVNLIGEHTDYNGGMVLPTALPLGVQISMTQRQDNDVHIASDKFDDIAQRSLSDKASGHWSDYVTGAIILANEVGLLSGGVNMTLATNLPFGAGISSSAAVTVGVLKLARDLAGSSLSDTDISVLARRVENEFIGMPCGIMDQMAVAIARPGQALALDTKSLNFNLIDLPTDYHMAVIHSGLYRQLNEGRYKERKEECDAVKAALGHDDLCLMTDAEYVSLSTLPDMLLRRARHCMTEHHRTVRSIEFIQSGKIDSFGKLMNESHKSMRDDFEITLPKVDRLVEDAVDFGAVGARQTGGGFGGCIVACVANERLEDWRNQLLAAHPNAFWVA